MLIGESNVAIDPSIGGYGVADIYLGEFSPHSPLPGTQAGSYENAGVAKSLRGEALTGHLIVLTVAEANRTDSTINKRKETNINARVVS